MEPGPAHYSPELGRGTEVARERDIALIDQGDLGEDFDAALVQDGGVSFELADRCPGVPQLFVAHSEMFDLQAPPQLDGMAGLVVALNDRIAERLCRYATQVEVVRLRQPIDTERFTPRGALPEVAHSALLLSNNLHIDRLAMLETACAEAGLELKRVGGLEGSTVDPRPALVGSEIVIGYGRSILEAMACGRAAYVYDWNGGDGWVTPESYPAIEADGIAGRSGRMIVDARRLTDDLRGYDASMGPANHDLVMAHHRANVHAQQLVGLFERLADPPPRPRAPLQEMARLVRLEWRAQSDARGLIHENAHLRDLLRESQEETKEAVAREEARVEETIRAFKATTSWRLTKPVRALGRLRGGRGR